MLRKSFHAAREFYGQLREEFAAPRRYTQDLVTESDFFRSLNPTAIPELELAVSAFTSGHRSTAVAALASYYRNRSKPLFFISAEQARSGAALLKQTRPDWVNATLDFANTLKEGRLGVYASEARLTNALDWATAPTGPGRDQLYRYRAHRFGFVPQLALASLYGDAQASRTLEKLVGDWAKSVQKTDDLGRSRWRNTSTSSHVAVYRTVALSWAMSFLLADSEVDDEFILLCLRIVLGDARHIFNAFPTTARNNHLLADGFGAWFLGLLYPEFNEARTWQSSGNSVFKQELLRQIYPDGSSFEHSLHYQEHVCEMGLAYLLLSEKNNLEPDGELSCRIEAMLAFQAAVVGPDATALSIGDTTEDPLFPLDVEQRWCSATLRTAYAQLFQKPCSIQDDTAPDLQRYFWLFGARFPVDCKDQMEGPTKCQSFDDGGFIVFRGDSECDRLIFRTGPAPGSELVPGHMHFDFLSVYLVLDGTLVLVPSGTYTYRSTTRGWQWKYGDWRHYFMSARAANGLCLSDLDPLGRPRSNFPGGVSGDIDCRVATSPVLQGDVITLNRACITGGGDYAGWSRTVLQILNEYWLVIDLYPETSLCLPRQLGFQLPAKATVETTGGRSVKLGVEPTSLELSVSEGFGTIQCLRGSKKPRGGWLSNAYGSLVDAPQLVLPIEPETTCSACLLTKGGQLAPDRQSVSIKRYGSSISVKVCRADQTDRLEIHTASRIPRMNVTWQRTQNGETISKETLQV